MSESKTIYNNSLSWILIFKDFDSYKELRTYIVSKVGICDRFGICNTAFTWLY